MRYKPETGVLLISPIEEPNEKHFIEVVGQPTNYRWGVIEASNPASRPHLTPGTLVAFHQHDGKDIPLDKGVLHKILYETNVVLHITAAEASEVKRKNMSPEQIKAIMGKAEEDAAAAQRRAALATGTN